MFVLFVPDRDVVTEEWRMLLNNKLCDYIIESLRSATFTSEVFWHSEVLRQK